MKYVIFKKGDMIMPVVFSNHICHSEVNIIEATPVSAGFVNIINYETYGHSESLNLKPHKEDSHYIALSLIGMGSGAFADTFNNYK